MCNANCNNTFPNLKCVPEPSFLEKGTAPLRGVFYLKSHSLSNLAFACSITQYRVVGLLCFTLYLISSLQGAGWVGPG